MIPPEYANHPSETGKYRSITSPLCQGCGIDIASHGDPVVPWAWQLELPESDFKIYNADSAPLGPVQLRGTCLALPVEFRSLDFVYASHLLEDFAEDQWNDILREWSRPLKIGGNLVILVPERNRWAAALAAGQPPNCSHKYEPLVGDLTRHANELGGLVNIQERLTNLFEGDYTILFTAKKT
jgi:SAM-dependent methyltransferase